MTNKERTAMYKEWEEVLEAYSGGNTHDDRVCDLQGYLRWIGEVLQYDMSSLLRVIDDFDIEVCKPLEVRVDGIYRVIKKVYQNDTDVCLNVGDIVRVERVGKELSSVKSLMLNPYSEEAIDIYNFKLEEV